MTIVNFMRFNHRTSERGSTSVEFVVGFIILSLSFMILLKIFLISVRTEILSYVVFMGGRVLKVNNAQGVDTYIRSMIPKVPEENIRINIEGDIGRVGLGDINVAVVREAADRKVCEDNPLWNIKGDILCP